MNARVYLACAKKDLALARSLKNFLDEDGCRCHLTETLGPSDTQFTDCCDAIAEAHVIVLLYTENCYNSNRLRNDLACGAKYSKPVIVYRLDPSPPRGYLESSFNQNYHVNVYEMTGTKADARLMDLIKELSRFAESTSITLPDQPRSYGEVSFPYVYKDRLFTPRGLATLTALMVIIPLAVFIIMDTTASLSDEGVNLEDDTIPAAQIIDSQLLTSSEAEETTSSQTVSQ